jgi:hypothetical protein
MQHVRDHLVAMLEALGDKEVDPQVIERAKATAEIAQVFTNTVKVELEAYRIAGRDNQIPSVLEHKP